MQRLRLAGTVRITGRDFWGRKSTLVIEPLTDQADYRWSWRVGGYDVPITPRLFEVGGFLGRCVVLVCKVNGKVYRFHEFEHIAFLYALGLRSVRIWLEDSDWLPYMCQLELRRQTKPLLLQQGQLRLFDPERAFIHAPIGEMERHVRYIPDRPNSLVLTARVDYDSGWEGSHLLDLWSGVDESDLVRVLSARTLGKPSFLKLAAWPASFLPQWQEQSKKIVWGPLWGDLPLEVCDELAQHKVFDDMLVSFAARPDCFLGGTVESYRPDHGLVLKLTKQLYPEGTVTALRKAV